MFIPIGEIYFQVNMHITKLHMLKVSTLIEWHHLEFLDSGCHRLKVWGWNVEAFQRWNIWCFSGMERRNFEYFYMYIGCMRRQYQSNATTIYNVQLKLNQVTHRHWRLKFHWFLLIFVDFSWFFCFVSNNSSNKYSINKLIKQPALIIIVQKYWLVS